VIFFYICCRMVILCVGRICVLCFLISFQKGSGHYMDYFENMFCVPLENTICSIKSAMNREGVMYCYLKS
jgi:hypothetical protein